MNGAHGGTYTGDFVKGKRWAPSDRQGFTGFAFRPQTAAVQKLCSACVGPIGFHR